MLSQNALICVASNCLMVKGGVKGKAAPTHANTHRSSLTLFAWRSQGIVQGVIWEGTPTTYS